MGRHGHGGDVWYRVRGVIQQGLRITQTLSAAQPVAATRGSSPGAAKTFMQSDHVGMKIQSDGTQTVLLLLWCVLLWGFFFPFFIFVFSLAGPNSLSSASAEAVQNLRRTASPQLQRRANPSGMPDRIPGDQILELQPQGPALDSSGAISPHDTHPLQGASTPVTGNKG